MILDNRMIVMKQCDSNREETQPGELTYPLTEKESHGIPWNTMDPA